MVEPTSIVLGAAIGGVAGKFVEKAWNLGEKWISSYFKDHAPKAKEQAQKNSLDFLSELAKRVKKLEEQGEQQKKIIKNSLNQPDFSVLLQKALISSAQTKNKQKHEILANIVADRLSRESESLLALCGQQAVDIVPLLNSRQMKILAFLTTVFFIRPKVFPPPNIINHDTILNMWYQQWLTDKLRIYGDLTVSNIDFLHLESLSCIKWDTIISRDLGVILNPKPETNFKFDKNAFLNTTLGKKINELWQLGLKSALPTTVGQIIGVYTSDNLTGEMTSLNGFGEH